MLEKLPESIGHALQGQRAGLEKILFNRLDLRAGTGALEISSTAFVDHGPIPVEYTADGEGLSPPLSWRGVPPGATSLALLVEDADSPTPEPLVHTIAVGIEASRDGVRRGELLVDLPAGTVNLGRNSFLQQRWLPPDPPPGHGAHRYAFQVFALAGHAPFPDAPGRAELKSVLLDQAVASGLLIGTYERSHTVKADPASQGADISAALIAPAL